MGKKKDAKKVAVKTEVAKSFEIGEHKDDKRYIEYLRDCKIMRKYKDNCKLTYSKDSAGKAIRLEWITYKH